MSNTTSGAEPDLPSAARLDAIKEPPALAHIEKTLTDSYRKEVDQEENIWRSLPFFAATLALQLSALFQVIERLPTGGTWSARVAQGLVWVSLGSSLTALIGLGFSIRPARFQYVAKDAALLDYAFGLIEDERHPGNLAKSVPMVALHELKANLATQYAAATDHNRQINKLREKRRSIAGLFTLLSVVTTLLLAGVTFATYMPKHDEKEVASAPRPQKQSDVAVAAPQPGPVPRATNPQGTPNAGSQQGVVHHE